MVLIFSLPVQFSYASDGSCERYIVGAAKKHKVPFAILYAVGLTESGSQGRLHPFALNVEGKTFFPQSEKDALRIFYNSVKSGKVLIDLGCMQINHKYHGSSFKSLSHMLSPQLNVDYAAKFLRRLKNRHGSWSIAVARYHAGDKNHAAQKKYVCRVLKNMISQKVAKATARTKKLCNTVD